MSVFAATAELGGFLRDCATAAAIELGVVDALATRELALAELADAIAVGAGRHRLAALLDVLAAIGVVARAGERFGLVRRPTMPVLPAAGWGRLAEVIRDDHPLVVEGPLALRYHDHLLRAGAESARELAGMLPAGTLLDLGGGAGAYTHAYLAAHATATATLVDAAAVIALAADHLAGAAARVQLVAGDARTIDVDPSPWRGATREAGRSINVAPHDVVLLANVLHLHGPQACAELCAAAARAAKPGGIVAIVDMRVDEDRAGPIAALLFALDMAAYTPAGSVYETSRICGWLAEAGLVDIAEHRLETTPDAVVVVARRPALPPALATALDTALAIERESPSSPTRAADLARHYQEVMPRMHAAQLAGATELDARFFHAPLDWSRLPRLAGAIERLYALLATSGVGDARPALGMPTAAAFRAATPTLAALYTRTYYGSAMPLLYGFASDLAYFARRGADRGLDTIATIDRYLTAPIIHELCHFGRAREALEPLHLDECIAGWLGVHVHPEFAFPAPGEDDAIYAAPWLSQVGQAFARAFGIAGIVRAHAGAARWDAVLPAELVATARRLGRDDWRARRSLHLLADPFAPTPWVALALAAGAGRSVAGAELATLAVTAALAVPVDPDFDRAIVADALRAMCLDNACVDGSLRARTRIPDAAITIDASACLISTDRRGDVDTVAPTYWLPPIVARGLRGRSGRLQLASIDQIPAVAAALVAGEQPTGLVVD